jgi:putative ABC transport system permease protein
MLLYNLRIALRSLRRNPVLTAIIIGGIALGICASTTFITVRHMYTRDPLPGKSQDLYYVRLDNWNKDKPYPTSGSINRNKVPPQITYRDAMELVRSNIPTHQALAWRGAAVIYPDRSAGRPYNDIVRLCTFDFFNIFDVPFQYGRPWDRVADDKGEQVAVIDQATNTKVFHGGNSVGKRLRVNDRDFTVVGVLAPWNPFVRMYEPTGGPTQPPEGVYLPFRAGINMQLLNVGESDTPSWATVGPKYEDKLASDMDWIQLWVVLPPDRVAAYHSYVDGYVLGQKKLGRFPRPLNNSIMDLRTLMTDVGFIQPQLHAMAAISILFLIICALNLTGLLLAKFLARTPEVSVRRALGATRADIFLQHILECEIVGIAGGAIGMLISAGVLRYIAKLISTTSVITLDAEMIAAAVFLSLVAGLTAGLYPAWRICSVQPAVQLKI